MTLLSLIAGLCALKLVRAACYEQRTVKVYPSTPLVLSCTAPKDFVTHVPDTPGALSTDGNKFELYVFDAENKALYDSKQRFRCGYAYCGEPRTVWSGVVPTDRTASAVFVVIECLGGSLFNSNCDIELQLWLNATTASLAPLKPPQQCQTKAYCTNMCGITDTVGAFGVCCSDCDNSTSVALPVGTGSACRNQCPGIGTATATPMPIAAPPAPAGKCQTPAYCQAYCGVSGELLGYGRCCGGCRGTPSFTLSSGTCTTSCPAYADDDSLTTTTSRKSTLEATPAPPRKTVAPCDCDCVQQRCRDRCGSGGSSPTINTCSSLNGAILDQCVCSAVAPAVSAAESLLGTHAHAAGLIAVPFFLRCLA